MDDTTLAARIAGRKEFEALLQLAVGADVDPAWLDGFARAARDWAAKQLGEAGSELMVMSHDNAIRYGKRPINYGEYNGTPISDIPIERLTWYADAAVPLQAYLRSDVGQKRIDDGK